MKSKKVHSENQTITELFNEYSYELDDSIESFVLNFGYLPLDPNGWDYSYLSMEKQAVSELFFKDSRIQKLDTLATLFYDLKEYFK